MPQPNSPPAVRAKPTNNPFRDFETWFSPWKLMLLVAGLLLVTFPEVFFKGEVFFYRDAGIFNYPTHFHHRESFRNFEMPLWNPYSNCGIPFLAQWNVMALYPFSLIYVLLPVPWAITFFSLAHFLLAAAGMYFLAHRWTSSRFAACVAGLGFAWNGITLHATMWPNSCASLGWMPWTVLLMERAMRDGGRYVLYAGLAGAMQMLGGVPEIILLTWVIVAGIFLLELKAQKHGRVLWRGVLAGLIVTGLTAVQMLPFLDLLQHSQRSAAFAKEVWAMPLWGFANFFVPAFRTSPDFLGVYTQTEQLWTTTYYSGTALLGLAALGIWRARQPRVWMLIVLTVIGLLLALGSSGVVFAWVKKAVPFLGIIRYPAKWVQLATFCLPLLAAYGIQWLQTREETQTRNAHRNLLLIGGVILLIIGVVIGLAFRFPREDEPGIIALKNGIPRAVFLVAILGIVANLFSNHPLFSRRIMALLVLMLIGLDISFHQPKLPPTVAASSYQRIAMPMSSVPKLGESRAMLSTMVKGLMRKAGTRIPKEDFLGKRWSLFMNANFYDHVPKVDGLFSLYPKAGAEIEEQIYTKGKYSDGLTKFPAGLADFLGVTQMTPQKPGSSDEMFTWVPRPTALPLATTGQKPIFVNDSESLEAVFSPNFNPVETVYLPKEAESAVKAKTRVKGGQVSQVEFKAQRIIYKTKTDQPSLLVVAQTYYYHWKAYVDGQSTPVWRANHAFQAIEIPAGEHEVRLVYEDNKFKLGAMISGGTLLLVVLSWFLVERRQLEPTEVVVP